MKNPYQYCSRCGDELSEQLQERYKEEHQSGPVLCLACVKEVIIEIRDSLHPVFKQLNELANEFVESINKAFEA